MTIETRWLMRQVKQFEKLRPGYKKYARLLEEILEAACCDFRMIGIVNSRVKSIPSFTEKCIRKSAKHDDPVNQLTDLCGARVILHTRQDVERVSQFVRKYFRVDEANSVDAGAALRTREFGYQSVHFIVQLDPRLAAGGPSPSAAAIAIPVKLTPSAKHPFKAEIQIRTIVQHAWADIGHDRIYKSKFVVPRQLDRQSARVAALLEQADDAFERLVQGIDAIRLQFDAYMTREQLEQEIEVKRTLLARMPEDEQIVRDLARLYLTIDDCASAIAALDGFAGEHTPAIKSVLGHALCSEYDRHTSKYARGKKLLREAADAEPPDHDAIMRLADVCDRDPGDTRREVRGLYEQAFGIDPSHPRALGGYLETKVRDERSLDLVSLLRPMLAAGVEKCRGHAEVGVHLPDALYRAGEFLLFLDRPYEALQEYTRAIARTTNPSHIDSALLSLDRVSDLSKPYVPIEWARRLLLLAKACKFDGGLLDPHLQAAATNGYMKLDEHGPVVIVAGGCDPQRAADMKGYAALLHAAFHDFRGVIISGGTEQGVSGLVGELGEKHDGILTIGYLPTGLPHDATKDHRYTEFRTGIGDELGALQPLQNWIDLMNTGIAPGQVTVLGINGGTISEFEYRLACALGAKVGVLRESGRVVGALSREADQFDGIPGLAFLPHDVVTVKSFIEQDLPTLFADDEQRTSVAQAIHEHYRNSEREQSVETPTMVEWEKLDEQYKHSNIAQADHIARKLEAVGLEAVRVSDREITRFNIEPYVEELAEREHARWLVERAEKGWRFGETRDNDKRLHPDMVPWEKLSSKSQEKDRSFVRAIPELLRNVGFEIRKKS